MASSMQTDLSEKLSVRVPVIGAVFSRLKESLMLSVAASGLLLFLFSALVLTALGKDVLAALFGVMGINVTIIGLLGYAAYHILDRFV